jgi:hypothetical protein
VDYLKSMVHTTAVNITKMFGITGRVISSSMACTTSSQSIGFGYESVKFGMQDAMLCGGADEYDTTTVAVFDNLLACSTEFNATPHLTPRPFDVRRDGLVVGEGARFLENMNPPNGWAYRARCRHATTMAAISPPSLEASPPLRLALADAAVTPAVSVLSAPRRPPRWAM